VGFARADVALEPEFARYESFVDAGMHGEMEFLASDRHLRRTLDDPRLLAGARSVVCLARSYARAPADEADDPPLARLDARYARGRDYHNFVLKKLRRLARLVKALGPGVDARALTDVSPVLERAWAARSGLGFVGKNGLVIVPGQGSLILLGEVVTTLDLPPSVPMADRCGACTRCLDACPTSAFPAPFVLDARRCVSYLTIEHRSGIAEHLRSGVGEHLFGCDDCQTVCPFNAARATRPAAGAGPFAPSPERWADMDLVALVGLTEAEFDAWAHGTPMRRAGRAGMARNAAIVLGNRADPDAVPTLERAAAGDPDAAVREAAAWAIDRIRRCATP